MRTLLLGCLICILMFGSVGAEELTFKSEPETVMMFTSDNKLQCLINNKVILQAEPNGDFYINGRLTTNDKEVYEMWKEWLEYTFGLIKENEK